jgi:hypothetical protein
VWLEDYRLACHAGRATDNLFMIKNLPLYLGDSARKWLRHLPRDKIQDWTDLRRVFVGNFQGTYMRLGKQWELRNFKRCTELPTRLTTTPSRCFRTRRRALPSSIDSGEACRV